MQYPRANAGKLGFTILELLIAIGVIAILLAILLPVFTRAKGAAGASACLSNLKQVGAALELYRSDHANVLPEHLGRLAFYLKDVRALECPQDGTPITDRDLNRRSFGYYTSFKDMLLVIALGEEEGKREKAVLDARGDQYPFCICLSHILPGWKHTYPEGLGWVVQMQKAPHWPVNFVRLSGEVGRRVVDKASRKKGITEQL
jgi:prepilin-type N-terminal cleavage/methylation domain-containing protein